MSPHSAPAPPRDLASWNRALNQTHAMAGLRARGGRVVRAIEARRRGLVARRVLRGPHKRVADVGCEDGWMAAAYASRVDDLVLVDVDEAVLAAAKRRLPGARTVIADAQDAASAREAIGWGCLDVIVLSALLEHVPRPSALLDGLARCLVPGGRFVIFVPADRPILACKRILETTRTGALVRGLSLDPAPGHMHVFDRDGLAGLLRRHGRVREIAFDPAVLGLVGVMEPALRARGR